MKKPLLGKNIVILGAGESGIGAALLAQAKGADVLVSDGGTISDARKKELHAHQIQFEEHTHTEEKILSADEIIKSPGIPNDIPVLKKAQQKGIPIISEIELASRYTDAKIIAITGTNGKSTTTLLVYHLLKTAGYRVGLAGNIGESFARKAAKEQFDYFVLELSSFQLEHCPTFHPHVSVILNITPDHLDRYDGDFQRYAEAKFKIIKNQTKNDFLLFPAADTLIQEKIKEQNSDVNVISVESSKPPLSLDASELPLKGKHNLINMNVACTAAQLVNVPEKSIKEGLRSFQNISHRLEQVLDYQNIKFINDSKATNVESVWYALDAFPPNKEGTPKIIWLAGGKDKGNDYSRIEKLVTERVKTLICIGADNEKLVAFFKEKVNKIIEISSMEKAVEAALTSAVSEDIVLLSPACSSFDLYKNFEDRGNQFKEAVNKLTKEPHQILPIKERGLNDRSKK